MAKAPTIIEIAKEAGVSYPTVSQVLNNKGQLYREITRQKVIEAAERLGYRPNASARAMVRGKTATIGWLLAQEPARATFDFSTLWAVQDVVSKRDLHLTMGRIPDEKLCAEGYIPKLLREWSADGLLISHTADFPPQLQSLIEKHKVPAVWMNVKLPTNCVYPDDYGAGRAATELLLAAGHRRVGYVDYSTTRHYSAADRRGGYEAVMAEAGLTPHIVLGRAEADDAMYGREMKALMTGPDGPTAWVTYSGREAGVLVVAGAKAGLELGSDWSLVAIREQRHPIGGEDVTTMQIPMYKLGMDAMEMLAGLIETHTLQVPARSVPHKFHEGRSVGPWKQK